MSKARSTSPRPNLRSRASARPPRDTTGEGSSGPSAATIARANASRQMALVAAEGALDKKGREIEIIDVVGRVDYADFLVIVSGTSDRHCAAIAKGVEERLLEAGHKALSVEGLTQGEWVLIDFFDVVVHVFSEDARGLYDLSGLWMDAGRVPLPLRPERPEDKFD